MGQETIYRLVFDNDNNLCVDNNEAYIYIDFIIIITAEGVEVRRVRHAFYPCAKCRFKNNYNFPKTQVHSVSLRERSYLPNLKAGQNQDFIEIVGTCMDFQART